MAAAREGRFEIHPDGSVTLAGVTVAADEVEIQASPKPGMAVAHDQGLVAVSPAARAGVAITADRIAARPRSLDLVID